MAKYYKRRFRKRTGKWSSNIQSLRLEGDAPANSNFGDSITIAQNPGQSSTSVSQRFTVKNIEITGIFELDNTSASTVSLVEDLTYYIMYVPEGYVIDLTLPTKHPEWIMAYKYIGSTLNANSTQTVQPPRIKTRLSRKLNSGDSIIFLYTGLNRHINDLNVRFMGLTRWWTKAN